VAILRPGLHFHVAKGITPAGMDIIARWSPLSLFVAMDGVVNDQADRLAVLREASGSAPSQMERDGSRWRERQQRGTEQDAGPIAELGWLTSENKPQDKPGEECECTDGRPSPHQEDDGPRCQRADSDVGGPQECAGGGASVRDHAQGSADGQ